MSEEAIAREVMELRLRLKELDRQRRELREKLDAKETKLLALKNARKTNQSLTVIQ